MIRILHSVSNMDRAGIETMLMNYYRHIDRSKIQFDFLCNKKKPGAYDAEIKEMGGNIYHTPGLNPAKYPSYLKCMKKIFEENPEYKIVEAHNGALGVYALHAAKVNHIPVRIFHAPSVGKTAADECVPEYVIRGIKKFKKISARDDLTEQLVCNITGTAPERVLDPTFLAEFPRAELAAKKKPYILFYYCENLPHNILNQIFSYAKEHGLAVYGAGECDKRYSEITVNLMPFEWVEMFRNAEFVFTGTFHGAVFSILNRRQFKVYLTNESRIKKVTALLEELGIQNRKMDSKFEFDLESMKNEINYDAVYRVINEKRQSSKQYLKDAIGMAKQ